MSNLPISSPAGYVPPVAITFADAGGGAVTASAASPVPVTAVIGGALPGFASPPTVAASQSGAWNIASITGSVPLPTGAASAALQTQLCAQFPATLGPKTSANALAVTLASDQTVPVTATISGTLPGFASPPTVAASQSGAWNITNITGTVALPTGAASAALQGQISAQLPTSLGPKASAAALAVTVASDQTVPVVPTMALAATSTALSGSTAATATVGPFTPQLGRDIRLKLWGTWTGSVQVQTSADGGTTKLPLTAAGNGYASFTAPCNETVDSPSDSADKYYLAITVASGTVSYRLAQ